MIASLIGLYGCVEDPFNLEERDKEDEALFGNAFDMLLEMLCPNRPQGFNPHSITQEYRIVSHSYYSLLSAPTRMPFVSRLMPSALAPVPSALASAPSVLSAPASARLPHLPRPCLHLVCTFCAGIRAIFTGVCTVCASICAVHASVRQRGRQWRCCPRQRLRRPRWRPSRPRRRPCVFCTFCAGICAVRAGIRTVRMEPLDCAPRGTILSESHATDNFFTGPTSFIQLASQFPQHCTLRCES